METKSNKNPTTKVDSNAYLKINDWLSFYEPSFASPFNVRIAYL